MTTPGFAALVESWLDGTLTVEEQAEMEAELLRSITFQNYFWEVASLHGYMRVAAKLELGCSELLSETISEANPAPASESVVQPTNFTALAPDENPVLQRGEQLRQPVLGFLSGACHLAGSWLSSPKALALTVVGCLGTYFLGLMISIAISRAFLTDRQAQERADALTEAPARIIAAAGCRWEDRAPRTDLSGKLPAGISRLAEGIVELEFEDGARVTIEGPAEFSPQSGQRMNLARGRLVAYVPRQARGFTVDTPSAEVVDLGTEFGVEVDVQGSTDLHVIRGRVDVKPAATASDGRSRDSRAVGGGVVRVSSGEAVRVSANSAAAERIALDITRFGTVRSSTGAVTAWNKRSAGPFLDDQLPNKTSSPAPATISVNFSIDDRKVSNFEPLVPSSVAGVVAAVNWNNLTSVNTTTAALKDDSGSATTASITTKNLVEFSFDFGGYTLAGPDATMLNDAVFLRNSDSQDVIDVSDIPYATYDVYVYANQGISGVARLSNFTIGATTIPLTTVNPYFPVPPYQEAKASDSHGNYVHFRGLTGSSFALSVQGVTSGAGANQTAIAGLQIVERVRIPEPATSD